MRPYISWPAGFVIHPRKITGYLFNPASRDRSAKAKFFLGYGFVPMPPDGLANALLAHTDLRNYVGMQVVPRGHELIFEGPIDTPNGPSPRIRSVRQVDAVGIGEARLLTACPL